MTDNPTKTTMTPAEALTRWGDRLYMELAPGTRSLRDFGGDGGVWRPSYNEKYDWIGYHLTKYPPAPARKRP